MAEENTIKPLKAITIKTEEETIARFNRLKDELGLATSGQMLTELLDRLEQPQRVADRAKELQATIDGLNAALDEVKTERDTLKQDNQSLADKLTEAQHHANQNAELSAAQQLAFQQQLDDLQPKDNQALISFTPDNLRVLDLVCARESKRRNQQWSRSHVINYFINARFVRGLLNGDLESIPDSELRRLGISLKNPGKEDFNL